MAVILPFSKDGVVFDPKDLKAMSMVLDGVCQSLGLDDGRQREVIAERIIELATQGIRNPTILRDRVLQEAGQGHRIGLTDGHHQTA
jgi:hypothetical protein